MKIIFTFLLFSLVNLSTPALSKDISPNINGKLKDECLYLTNLIERIILRAYESSPMGMGDDRLKEFPFIVNEEEVKRLEYLNPKITSILRVYLDLCK